MKNPLPGDWWLTVRTDLEELKLNISLHEIKQMSKEKFKTLKNVKSEALSWLLHRKSQSEKEKIVPFSRFIRNSKLSQHAK